MAQLPSLSTLIRTAAANLRLGADPAPAPVAPIRAMLEGQPELTSALRTTLQQSGPVAANVVAALGANRYLVEVDGEQLPVVLQLAAARPALDPGTAVRLIVQPSAPTPGGVAPASATASSEAELSAVGRMIADATRSALTSKSATPITFPALDAQPNDPQAIALALRRSVDESGLFYESHVVAWASGKHELAALQREPQAQPDFRGMTAADVASAHSETTSLSTSESPNDSTPTIKSEPPSPTTTPPIIREQLTALATQQLHWQGELWPHQPAEIEIGRAPARFAEEADNTWRVRIKMALPELGELDLRLSLRASDLNVDVRSPSSEARSILGASFDSLARALAEHGLQPSASIAAGPTNEQAVARS